MFWNTQGGIFKSAWRWSKVSSLLEFQAKCLNFSHLLLLKGDQLILICKSWVPGNPSVLGKARQLVTPALSSLVLLPTIRNPSIIFTVCLLFVALHLPPTNPALPTSDYQPFRVSAPPPRFFHLGNILVTQTSHKEEKTFFTQAAEGIWT